MNKSLKYAGLIQKYAVAMAGVFFIGDLCRLFGIENGVELYRRIRDLEEGGIVFRFSRGIYVTAGFHPETLAARIIEKSYLSLGTVLSKELMIGSVPAKAIYAVRIGKNRSYEGAGITVEYVGLAKPLYFGYRSDKGVRYASPEKALLDTLYFHLHGRSYSFDIYQDIDITRIDRHLVEQWLGKYRNPRFVSFVRGYLNDRS
jgi:hypothetical protein